MASPAICRAWGRSVARVLDATSLSSTAAWKFNRTCRARLFFSSCRSSGFSKLHEESQRSLTGSIPRSTTPYATSTRGLSTSSSIDGRIFGIGIELWKPRPLGRQSHEHRRLFRHMASGPGEPQTPSRSTNAPAPSPPPPQNLSKPPTSSSKPTDAPPSDIPTQAEQRRSDWSIIKRLMINVWPKNDWKTRWTVILGFALLVSAKVCKSTSILWLFIADFVVGSKRPSPTNIQVCGRFAQRRHYGDLDCVALGRISHYRMYESFCPHLNLPLIHLVQMVLPG